MSIVDFIEKIRKEAWNNSSLGTKFEVAIRAFLKTEPCYAQLYTDVWRWDDCPYVSGHDTGIDLVARDIYGEFTGIQCKCYQPGTFVDKPDVDTFLSKLGSFLVVDGAKVPYKHGIFVVTNNQITNNAKAALEQFFVPILWLPIEQLVNSTIDWGSFFAGKGAKLLKKHEPFDHQKRGPMGSDPMETEPTAKSQATQHAEFWYNTPR